MINNISLTGRLSQDPHFKNTNVGQKYTIFNLAVERSYKDSNGNKITDFIDCIAWGEMAETLNRYCTKGTLIGLVGELNNNFYTNKEGQNVYMSQVRVRNFTFLEKKNDNNVNSNQINISENDVPF